MQAKIRLDRNAVLEAAAELADAEGLEHLTLARLAERLGIRSPSLYNHVESLAGLRRDLAVLALDELNDRLTRAVMGRAGNAAVEALAHDYRAFAKEHPGLYAATMRAPDPEDEEVRQAAAGVVAVIVAVLAAYGLRGDDAVHAVRVLRSALDGFVMLETTGGFGMPLDLDETYRRLTGVIIRGFQHGS
jgi:AcrR family transcriptional regulator